MDLKLVIGNRFADSRGVLAYNNDFDASAVKRIYFIENVDTNFVRAWQGHKIEQRWFTAVSGSFEIRIIAIDDWDSPSVHLKQEVFTLVPDNLNVLQIPSGHITSIQALEENSKLMVMADYLMGENNDEQRFLPDYFQE